MEELPCVGKYDAWHAHPVKIPFQGVFRFWRNRCVQQEEAADEILENIYSYFTSLMQPLQKEEPQMDLALDFDHVSLLLTELKKQPRGSERRRNHEVRDLWYLNRFG